MGKQYVVRPGDWIALQDALRSIAQRMALLESAPPPATTAVAMGVSGTDDRLSNARAPTPHADSHGHDGEDPLFGADVARILEELSAAVVAAAAPHASSHEPGGSDPIEELPDVTVRPLPSFLATSGKQRFLDRLRGGNISTKGVF